MSIPGPQELALLVFVALGVFVLRRVLNSQLSLDAPAGPGAPARGRGDGAGNDTKRGLRTPTRLAIVGSALFLIGASLLLEPWRGDPVPFFIYGLLPICAAWGLAWALTGR